MEDYSEFGITPDEFLEMGERIKRNDKNPGDVKLLSELADDADKLWCFCLILMMGYGANIDFVEDHGIAEIPNTSSLHEPGMASSPSNH